MALGDPLGPHALGGDPTKSQVGLFPLNWFKRCIKALRYSYEKRSCASAYCCARPLRYHEKSRRKPLFYLHVYSLCKYNGELAELTATLSDAGKGPLKGQATNPRSEAMSYNVRIYVPLQSRESFA